ncbi:hypothetical protein Calab_0961 [Caldithrix abyssi DSM 13497]|uniref:DNRLRE domain-containing protein n=1 Tax=Caldithrix abyssi DSM 13497 TaxID=880073 RepID=H1XV89_CALAY|nr:hypothetical protein [Caldithrix abyssi]APF20952.1 hypothetical protein Cabys_4207 [Caldithrix abyssi DSM 13497]EHO40595.1 hypothetical protein Calab_0961 [Caldithrix abyssi DSM 13497]
MKKIVSLILLGMVIVACQNLNPIDPPEELEALDRLGTFIDTTFYADTAYFQLDKFVNTENSTVLSVGSFQGFQASIFMRFTRMPIDSGATYDSVYVILYHRHAFPEGGNDLTLMVSELTEEWPDSVNSFPEFHNYQPGSAFYTFHLTNDDTGLVVIPIDVEVFNRWVEAGEDNFGLIIKAQYDDNGFIKEFHNFYSEDPENWPKLVYRTVLDTTIEHDTTNIGIASTVFDYDFENPQNIFEMARAKKELLLASGIASRVIVKFDALKSIPVNSLIYKADMQFELNDEDFFDPGFTNRLNNDEHAHSYYLRWITSISEDGSQILVDSSFANSSYYSYTLYKDDNIIHFFNEDDQVRFGKGYLQGYLNGTYDSVWFYLQFVNEYQDLAIRRIRTLEENGIRLRVYYYHVQNEGF